MASEECNLNKMADLSINSSVDDPQPSTSSEAMLDRSIDCHQDESDVSGSSNILEHSRTTCSSYVSDNQIAIPHDVDFEDIKMIELPQTIRLNSSENDDILYTAHGIEKMDVSTEDVKKSSSNVLHTEPKIPLKEQLAMLPECPSLSKVPVNVALKDLNPYLTCKLCGGYLYEASTITECMHTFCKTCIVRYTERNLNCPTCDAPIHPTDPFVHIRNDSTIQDIVYKLLPQIAEEEIRREVKFYEQHEKETGEQIAPKLTLPPPPPRTPPPEMRPMLPSEIQMQMKKKQAEMARLASEAKEEAGRNTASSFKIKPGRKPAERTFKSQFVSLYLDYLYTEASTEIDEELLLESKFVRVTGRATVGSLRKFICKKLRLNKCYTVNIYYTDEEHTDLMESDVTLEDIRRKYYDGEDVIMELQYTFSTVS